jgi:hypothetical protein
MLSVGRVKQRVKVLLEYFAIEYVKAYKTALVLYLRDQKNGKAATISRPDFRLLLGQIEAKNPRIEGEVYVGEGLKDKKHWKMGKNYVVTETTIDEKEKKTDEGAGAVAPASPNPEGGAPAEASSSAGPDVGNAEGGSNDKGDTRVWLDDSCTEVCMNATCGSKFGFFNRRRHCRQ